MSEPRSWATFADAVLRRAARRRQGGWGQSFDPYAGTVVRIDDVDRLLAELPSARTGTPTGTDVDDDVDAARRELHDEDAAGLLPWLTAAAGLDAMSVEILALATAIAWSPARLRVLAFVQDDLTVRGLMVASIPSLLDAPDDAMHLVAPDSSLQRACLIELDPPDLSGAALVVVPPAVQWYLLGDESRDPDLPARAVVYPGSPAVTAGRWLVHGTDRVRRMQAAAELCGTSRLLVAPEPTTDREWAAVVRTAVCRGFAVVLETGTAVQPLTTTWLARADTVPWIIASRHPLPLDELPPMPFVEHPAADDSATADEVIEILGSTPIGHRLSSEQLQVLSRIDGIPAEDALRRLASGALDALAIRVRPTRTWDDLVLPPDRISKVREVAARVRFRAQVFDEWSFRAVPSSGVIALFAGPPGTGKSMSAEIIAGDLGLDMFRIDLSTVVSKYIGDTEKHLERVFSAAEGSGVVLVFDEADALFGKRTKVADAHDRYANLETSYLLQRIEVYDGLTVLTSNMASNIDEAFLRRVHVFVDFPMPEEDERRAIWHASFPKSAPLVDVDFDFLGSRFPISGGSIRSASLTAAFSAAADGSEISMPHVVYGLMREYEKLGRMITPEQFGVWIDTAIAQRSGGPGVAGH